MGNTAEKRKHPRYKVSHTAAVRRLDQLIDPAAKERFQARMVDLSLSGAKLELREMLQPKERVHLAVDDVSLNLDCAAVVCWSRRVTGGYTAGLRFLKVKSFKALAQSSAAAKAAPGGPNAS